MDTIMAIYGAAVLAGLAGLYVGYRVGGGNVHFLERSELAKAIAIGTHLRGAAFTLIREVEAFSSPECYEGATGEEMRNLRDAVRIWDTVYPSGKCPHDMPWDDCPDCCH